MHHKMMDVQVMLIFIYVINGQSIIVYCIYIFWYTYSDEVSSESSDVSLKSLS